MLTLRDVLLWLYWHPFRLLVQRIGAQGAYRLAGPVAKLLYRVAYRKRAAFKRELDFIKGQKTTVDESRAELEEAFRILICNEFEVLLFPSISTENISASVVYQGLENLDRGLSRGKGVLLLFAHFGANQMIMPGIGYRGYTMSQLSAPPTVWPEKLTGREFTAMEKRALGWRWTHEQSLPVTHINIFGSLRKAFLCLKHNEILGVAMDGGGGNSRVSVCMFGRQALFSLGSVQLAMRTGCVVLPVFMIRELDGRSRMVIEPELPMLSETGTGDIESKTLQAFVQRLEHYTKKYPSHYVQFLALRRFMAQQGDSPLFPQASFTATEEVAL